METIIVRFVTALREKGLRVSPGESLDAVCALALGGLDERKSARALLQLTLVKNVHDIPVFDEVFDRFFSSYPAGMDIDVAVLIDEAISMQGEPMPGAYPDMYDDDVAMAMVDAGFSPEDLKDLQSLKEIDLENLDGSEIQVKMKGYREKIDAPRPSMCQPQNPVTMSFHQKWSNQREVTFTQQELDAMEDAVSRMILRLKKDVRRLKNKENRGKIHVIRTIQKNIRHGMVPFLLSLRRKRKQKPRLVVLCDVSFSVSHASQFMLLLLHTLHNRLMDVRSFVFNRELAEITGMLFSMPVNTMLETIDKGEVVNLDDDSDFGHVFLTFKEKYLENLRGRPAVIFLGDARNNYNEANDWVLDEIREKAGYMLWLTPEERDTWKRGDCLIETYGAYCDKVEVVRNVEELELIVEDLFHSLYLEHDPRSGRGRLESEAEENYNFRNYYTRGSSGASQGFDPEGRSHW